MAVSGCLCAAAAMGLKKELVLTVDPPPPPQKIAVPPPPPGSSTAFWGVALVNQISTSSSSFLRLFRTEALAFLLFR